MYGPQPGSAGLPIVTASEHRIGYASVDDLIQLDYHIDWAIPDMLPMGSVIVLAGAAKFAGKSMLAQYMGLCLARGRPFLGRMPPQRRRVLFSSFEEHEGPTSMRLRRWGIVGSDGLPTPMAYTFTAEAFTEAMATLMGPRQGPPGVWIIDTLAELGAHHGYPDDSNNVHMRTVLHAYLQLAYHSGWAIVIIHHFRKAGDTLRGGSMIQGATSGWWEVRHQQGSPIKQVEWFLRDGPSSGTGFEVVTPPAPDVWRIEAREMPNYAATQEGQTPNGRGGNQQATAARRPARLSDEELGQRLLEAMDRAPDQVWTVETVRSQLSVGTQIATRVLRTLVEQGAVRYSARRAGPGGRSGYSRASEV